MDNFDLKKYLAEGKLNEGALMNNTYLVSIRTPYGTLNEIEVLAENENKAFEKALEKAKEAIDSSHLDQIEIQ